MCDHEFEVEDEIIFSTTGDEFVPSEFDPLESKEFAPLIETADPLIYRNNGFRITGLPVNATERDIARHLKEFVKLAKVGRATYSQSGPLPLTPDNNDIQSANDRLKDSDSRLVDEFLWFWPTEWNRPIEDDLLTTLAKGDINSAADILIHQEARDQRKKVATHNLAVLFHAAALDLEFDSESRRLSDEDLKKRDVYWLQAFRYWKALINDEGFWKHFSFRIAQLDDPRFTTGQIRGSLPLALTLIVAKLALSAAEKGAFTEATLYLHLISGSGIDQKIISKAMVRVVRPLHTRIVALCDSAKTEAIHDHLRTEAAIGNLLSQSMPQIEAIKCLLSEEIVSDTQLLEDACDEVAKSIHTALISFANKTEDWVLCAKYLEQAQSIAVNHNLREQISEALGIIQRNAEISRQHAERQRIESYLNSLLGEVEYYLKSALSAKAKFEKLRESVQGHLTHIQKQWGETSEVFTTACNIVAAGLRGVAIELHNAAQQYQLALEAVNLASNLCRDAELKQRLRDDYSEISKHAEYDKLTKDLRSISSAPSLGSVNGIGTTLYGCSDFDRNSNSYLTTLYFIFLAIPIFPIARYRVIASEGNSYRFLGKAPLRRVDVVHRLVVLSMLVGWFSMGMLPSTEPSLLTGVTPTPTATVTVSTQHQISELVEYLNNPDPQIRLWAAMRLAERGGEAKQAIPELRSKLKDKNRDVRVAAQAALAKIAPGLRADAYSQNLGIDNHVTERPPPPNLRAVTPADGRAFNNQSLDATEQLRNEIESAKEQLRQLGAEMNTIGGQINSLKLQIDASAATLRRYERDIDLGYQADMDSYKNTVTRHNSFVQEYNQLLTEYRSINADHKALVRETNAKVDRYNSMIRGQR
jgi:peptidoglycan hydrolase CwlO-like protein